jgi:hypothetical protein
VNVRPEGFAISAEKNGEKNAEKNGEKNIAGLKNYSADY